MKNQGNSGINAEFPGLCSIKHLPLLSLNSTAVQSLAGVLSTHLSRLYSLNSWGERAGSSRLSESDRESVRWTFRPVEFVRRRGSRVNWEGWMGYRRGEWRLLGYESVRLETFDWQPAVVHTELISLAKLKVNSLNYYRKPNNKLTINRK